MAESRKIVKSGNTSYIVSLPINWIRKNELESGNHVEIEESELGDLTISAKKNIIAPKKDIITIKVDGKDDETINFEFLAAYIKDPASIIFEGESIVSKTNKLLDEVRFFIGLDVVEQTTQNIVVKNFFSLDKETSPSFLVKRMDMVNKASFVMVNAFFKKSFANEDFFELQKLNEQNKRLFILVRKSSIKLFEYPNLMKKIQTNHLQVSKEKIFAKSFRHISRMLLSLGNTFLFLDPSKQGINILREIFTKTESDYNSLINAINNRSHEDIYLFLRRHSKQKIEINHFLKTLEDPLMIQTINSLLSIYNDLEDAAREALV